MTTQPLWNSLEIAKLLVALITPIVITVIGYWISAQLKAQERRWETERADAQQQHEELRELELREREAEKDEMHRLNSPHIELNLECQFAGLRNGQHLTTFYVVARNTGQVIHRFERIVLRVRGIQAEPFQFRAQLGPYADFPHKLFETNLVPSQWNFVFIEPNVTQRIPLTTLIPAEYTYLLAYVEFEYKDYWPHTAEAVFAVPVVYPIPEDFLKPQLA